MIEPPIASEPAPEQPWAPPDGEPPQSAPAAPAESPGFAATRDLCVPLARAGTFIAWALLALGLVASFGQIVPLVIDGEAKSGVWARAWASAVFSILAFGLAGLAAATLAKIAAASVAEYLVRMSRATDELASHAARSVAQLERIVELLAHLHQVPLRSEQQELDRGRRIAEVQHAIQKSQFDDAEVLLTGFAAEFPDDAQRTGLEKELEDAKHNASHVQLAKLDAAREVNDADGVLETYQNLTGLLAADARAALDRDLAKWFLALIHRRLRTTKIGPDVVQLATRFADAFASTAEGASVRAALPTLRRSVGLCPRCGSAYGGVGEACPKCLQTISLRIDEPDSDRQSALP